MLSMMRRSHVAFIGERCSNAVRAGAILPNSHLGCSEGHRFGGDTERLLSPAGSQFIETLSRCR